MQEKNKKNSKLTSALKQAFPFFNQNDNDESLNYEVGASYVGSLSDLSNLATPNHQPGSLSKQGRDTNKLRVEKLPSDRFAQYEIFQEMAVDPTIDAAINLHLGHALSVPIDGGLAVYLKPKDEKHTEYVEQLNKELIEPINEQLTSWAYSMAIYGVNYVRPYYEKGKGITHFESNFYTLPNRIREYERSGALCGFTSENLLRRKDGEQVRLAEPWALIPLKMPIHRPDMKKEPVQYGSHAYSLYDDAYSRLPTETQNYGTSLLYTAYEPWIALRQSIASLGASRVNASLIERIVGVNTDGLDVASTANYINMIADQMERDKKEVVNSSRKLGFIPTVINTFLPIMAGGGGSKGGVQIDTFTTDPNIAHIEDILFIIKRLASSLGTPSSAIGWEDQLAGGLGEGGFFRTSIQSALRANQIRQGVSHFISRAIDIHTIFKDGKVWTDKDRPFKIAYNSLNTAIAQEKASEQESNVNYATLLITALDTLENSPLNKSKELKSFVYSDLLDIEAERAKKIIKELGKGGEGEGEGNNNEQTSPPKQKEEEKVPTFEQTNQLEDEKKEKEILESIGTNVSKQFVKETLLEIISEFEN